MYLPAPFCSPDPAHALALVHAHPLASLVSTDDDGFPCVTHLPLHVQQETPSTSISTPTPTSTPVSTCSKED